MFPSNKKIILALLLLSLSLVLVSCTKISYHPSLTPLSISNASGYGQLDSTLLYAFEVNQEYDYNDEILLSVKFATISEDIGPYLHIYFEAEGFEFLTNSDTVITDFDNGSYKTICTPSSCILSHSFDVRIKLESGSYTKGDITLHLDSYLQEPTSFNETPNRTQTGKVYYVVDEIGLLFNRLSLDKAIYDSWDRLYVNKIINTEEYVNRYFIRQMDNKIYISLTSWNTSMDNFRFEYSSKNYRVMMILEGDYEYIYNLFQSIPNNGEDLIQQAYRQIANALVGIMLEFEVVNQQEFQTELELIRTSSIRESSLWADQNITSRISNWHDYSYTDTINHKK
jgi:hypothetical protein